MFTVPSADTLDAGNICFGVWTVNSSYKDDYLKVRGGSANSQATIMPIALTLGVGSFWEFYASYPNLLFNTEEDASHTSKGINPAFTTPAEIGTKLRFLGKRSSDFKMAVDLFARRTVSDDPNLDGVTDTGGRLIASLRNDTLGAHIYAGYLQPGSPHNSTASYDNEILYGAGIEYLPSPRLRLSIELTGNSSRDSRFEDPLELTAGLQYHLSPHLSLNVAASKGLSDSSPDWRLIAGLTSCQGVGTYIKPIPQVGRSTARDQRIEPGKPAKIVPISSLLVRAATAPPLSKLEMPLDENGEEIIIKPYGQQLQPQVQPGTQKAVQPAQPFQPFQPVQPVQPIQPVQPVQVQPAPAVQPLPVQPAPVVQPVAPVTPVEIPAKEVAPAAPALLPQEVPLPKESAEAASVQKPLSGEAAKEQRLLVYRKFRFPDVSFEYDQFTLSKDGKQAIADVAEQIRKDKRWIYIRIDGHTDGIGSDSYNQALAIKRAMAVANQLVSVEGIDATRIYVEGFGKSKPIADNATTEGRRINRRVELLMLVPKDAPL